MKRTLWRTALICILAILCILIPSSQDKDPDGKKSLLSYLSNNQYLGRWVGYAVNTGKGALEQDLFGSDISKSYAVTIDRDGIMLLDTPYDSTAFELQKIDGGVCYFTDGDPDLAYMEDGRLVLGDCVGGYDIYFSRSEDPIGTWEAVSYNSKEGTFPADILFSDGCILTLDENGTGIATINGKQKVNLHMPYQGGEFDGGGVFGTLKRDAQKDFLILGYGQDAVVTFQRRIAAEAGVTVEAVPPYYKPQPEDGDTQTMQLRVFSIAFPKEGWVSNMYNLNDAVNDGRIEYRYYDKNRLLHARFIMKAMTTEALFYRGTINELQEITNKAVLDEKQIGGITFSSADYVSNGLHYMEYAARVPESHMSLYIRIEESMTGYDYKPILDSISFTLPVLSPAPTDPPLPEDSSPYVPRPRKANIGGIEVKASLLPMDTPLLVSRSSLNPTHEEDGDILALHDDTICALTGRRLYALQIKEGRLVKSPVFPEGVLKLEDKYKSLSMTENGTLYVMDEEQKIFSVRDGTVTPIHEWFGSLAMHPSGEWGIGHDDFYLTEMFRFNISSMDTEDWALHYTVHPTFIGEQVHLIRHLSVFDDRVYAAGKLTGSSTSAVGVFDLDGNELFIIGSENCPIPKALYDVTDVAQTQNSIVILDSIPYELVLLSISGEYIGAIDCDQLLGTNNAEILSIIPAEDGMFLCATQTRADRSCTELLIFHITGI